jgi:hypothetical protein
MKPFIDQNLQLRVPESELQQEGTNRSHSPIYTHFIGEYSSISYFAPEVNETELYKAMADAQSSYESWKLMKKNLQKTLKINI